MLTMREAISNNDDPPTAHSGGRAHLRLAETFRNLFYTPIYVAVAGGFLYQEGLDVSLRTASAGRPAISLLKDGTADILQTGLSRSLMGLDEGSDDAPLHIAEINQRDGFFLVSRTPADGWKWTDLEGAALIPFGLSPVPWMSLKYALQTQGVDIDRVRLIQGLTGEEALRRFNSGEADYLHMPNPQAQQLIEDGSAHFAGAVGPVLGHICYSSFAVTPQYFKANSELLERFVRGFYSAQQWLAGSDANAVASAVTSFFPDIAVPVLERSIERYQRQDTWADDPYIDEAGFAALRDVLIRGGLVKGSHPYDRLVRSEIARRVIDG